LPGSITPEIFKAVMQNVAASVTVVTVNSPDGPVGITVSAFAPVSADPAIVLICIDKSAASLQPLLDTDGFTVNFLPEGAGDLALVFATPGADKFGSTEWDEPEVSVAGPVLDDAFQVFECEVVERLEMGDHWVIFGQVVEAVVRTGVPLVYLNRAFVELDVDD
jgi:flavin reductase (DIM6/NTAB) family NADH-FMN oxidoreductase RutF